jgi:hypothetical protein
MIWAPEVPFVEFGGGRVVFPQLMTGDPAVAVAFTGREPPRVAFTVTLPKGIMPPFLKPKSSAAIEDEELRERACKTQDEAATLGRRFLSAVSWTHRVPVRTRREVVSGRMRADPWHCFVREPWRTHGPNLRCVPDPATEEHQLALAYYREGLCINSVFYSFLAFAKVLNLHLEKGSQVKSWIDAAIPAIKDPRAVPRIEELKVKGVTFGAHMHKVHRCAIAHAFHHHQRVNPDDPRSVRLVRTDLTLMQVLAERFIEYELGIPSAPPGVAKPWAHASALHMST